MFATGVTMGLAEWIIDDTCFVIFTFMYSTTQKAYGLKRTK